MDAPTPSREDAQRELLPIAARPWASPTEADLRDYFRMPVADTKARIAELVEAGELVPAASRAGAKPAYLAPGAARPARRARRRCSRRSTT